MIIDTHCHFDMIPNPEAYISAREKAGDVVIGMTNLPSHFRMGQPHLNKFKHIRLALGFHPLLAAENKSELALFRKFLSQTSYIGEIGLDFSRDGISTKDEQISVLREILAELRGKKKINCLVKFNHTLLACSASDEPRIKRIVEHRFVCSPAMRIVVHVFLYLKGFIL